MDFVRELYLHASSSESSKTASLNHGMNTLLSCAQLLYQTAVRARQCVYRMHDSGGLIVKGIPCVGVGSGGRTGSHDVCLHLLQGRVSKVCILHAFACGLHVCVCVFQEPEMSAIVTALEHALPTLTDPREFILQLLDERFVWPCVVAFCFKDVGIGSEKKTRRTHDEQESTKEK